MRIYISTPAWQTYNVGNYPPGTSEAYWMGHLGDRVVPLLASHGHEVRLGKHRTLAAQLADANRWGYDLYIALHTNAGGGHGTTVYHNPSSTLSRNLALALIAHVAPFSIGVRSKKLYDGMGLAEVNSTRGKGVLLEVEFHDNPVGAAWIIGNLDGIASTVANGILDIAGREPTAPPVVVPAPPAIPPVGIFLVHAPRAAAAALQARAVSTGRAAWTVSAFANPVEALNHTDALRYLTLHGRSAADKFDGHNRRFAVLAVHSDFGWGDEHIRDVARAAGFAAPDGHLVGREAHGYYDHTDALAAMLETGIDVRAVFGEAS